MDVSRFSIDPVLAEGALANNAYRSVYYERLLSILFEKNENLYVKTDIKKDREKVFCFPALYWLLQARNSGQQRRALYLALDQEAVEQAWLNTKEIVATCGDSLRLIRVLDGDPIPEAGAIPELVFTTVQTFTGLPSTAPLAPRGFGFVIADQAEKIAELPYEFQKRLLGLLLPSWERKSLVIAGKNTPRAKNFAWDLADNPEEIKLGDAMGFAGTMATVSRDIKEADKIRYILRLLAEDRSRPLCIFCNLKNTAIELSLRLAMNGIGSDYITGNLNPDRKNQIINKALNYKNGGFALVLTDDGAKGVSRPEFNLVINYDIPLEPELYFERLTLLDRESPSAALHNLVCERYMYGIPAIERAIDTSLGVLPLESPTELPKDVSAGKHVEMPEPRFRGREDRAGRRSMERPNDKPAQREKRTPSHPERSPAQPERRPPLERPVANPYALSMEERLELYRKKYGGTSARKTTPTVRQTPAPAEETVQPTDENEKSRGLIGRLQDIFSARKE